MNILANLYKWFWTRIGGRPWTYIARDFYHKAEYFILVGIFVSGFFVGWLAVSWQLFLIIVAVYSLGYIHGHFFWGTSYIEGQEGDDHAEGQVDDSM